MKENYYNISLAGITIPCKFQFTETASYFPEKYIKHSDNRVSAILIDANEWNILKSLDMIESPYSEASLMTAYLSEALTEYQRAIVHGVAIRWKGKAYLICANPGVGKSTQARFLQELRPGEFEIICGDRPVIQAQLTNNSGVDIGKGEVIVHPSPWNGKENWHGAAAAPLGGLILLERGSQNKIKKISELEAILPMYTYFIQLNRDEEVIKRIARLETCLLRAAPIWKLTSFQVPASTRILLDEVFIENN